VADIAFVIAGQASNRAAQAPNTSLCAFEGERIRDVCWFGRDRCLQNVRDEGFSLTWIIVEGLFVPSVVGDRAGEEVGDCPDEER